MKQIIFFIFSALLLIGCQSAQNGHKDNVIQTVSTEEFKSLIESEQGIILDVRTPQEFAESHLHNALNIDVNSADFASQTAQMPRKKPIYVYCRSGRRSLTAADILKNQKFVKIYNLKGGILEWASKGFEIE